MILQPQNENCISTIFGCSVCAFGLGDKSTFVSMSGFLSINLKFSDAIEFYFFGENCVEYFHSQSLSITSRFLEGHNLMLNDAEILSPILLIILRSLLSPSRTTQ